VTNNSCAAVTVNGLSVASRRQSGNCIVVPKTQQLVVQTSNVGPGSTAVIRTGPAAGTAGLGLCCFFSSCQTGSCVQTFDYTLTTSAGTFMANNSYTINFPNPNSCPPKGQCPNNLQVPPYGFGFGGAFPMPVCGPREHE
jgi:hypothetical protein